MNILSVQSVSRKLGIITNDDNEKIKCIARGKDKASSVLREIGQSLEVGINESFFNLLTIMDEHGGDAAVLASIILNELVNCTNTESRRCGK